MNIFPRNFSYQLRMFIIYLFTRLVHQAVGKVQLFDYYLDFMMLTLVLF